MREESVVNFDQWGGGILNCGTRGWGLSLVVNGSFPCRWGGVLVGSRVLRVEDCCNCLIFFYNFL